MPSNKIDRKIAVIFVADVVGYSKLVEDFKHFVVIIFNLRSLADGCTEGIAFDEHIRPLKADIPTMDVFIRTVRIRH